MGQSLDQDPLKQETAIFLPLQYSCLENSINRGVWLTTVHGVTELDITKQVSPKHIIKYKPNINSR